MASLPQRNVSFYYSLHLGGNTLQDLHYWVDLNLTEIHHDLVRVFGNPVLAALLSLCLHSDTLGPPQQSQVRWAQHLHHTLTLLPQLQHVRMRNSLLGGTVCIRNIPKIGKKALGDAMRNLSIFQANLSTVLSTIWLKLVIGKQKAVLAHADTVPL